MPSHNKAERYQNKEVRRSSGCTKSGGVLIMTGDQLYTLGQIQSVLAVVTQSECIDTRPAQPYLKQIARYALQSAT